MRKYLWIAILLLACNSNDKNSSTVTLTDTSVSTAENKDVVASGACNKLIFFQPGAEVESKTYNASGKEVSIQHTKIVDVKSEAGMTVAYVEASDVQAGNGKTSNMKYNYKCDGDKIYFDMASMLRTEAKESEPSFKVSVIEYPINITGGETLPDATGTMSSESNGKKMGIKYHYRDRKVEAKEEVTTSAGTWSCYKISNSIEVEMDMPGLDDSEKKMMEVMKDKMKTTSITWFAPDFGIVKMEIYRNGKMQTRTEITGIKR